MMVPLPEDLVFIRYAVADHIVDGGAHALREALVVQRGGDASVRDGVVVHQPVYLGGAHARLYVGGHMVQNRRVQVGAPSDLPYLLRALEKGPVRDDLAFGGQGPEFDVQFIHKFVTSFLFDFRKPQGAFL